MLKNIFKILAFFVIGVVGGIFADQILWPYFIERPLFYQYRLEQTPVNVTEVKEIYIQENIALKNAIEKAEKAIVRVETETKTGKILEGSALILTTDGLVVTLAELVPQSSVFNFFVDEERVPFQVLKRDLENNLALIKLEKTKLPTLGFADLEKLKLGERVFLLGATSQGVAANEGIVTIFDENAIQTNIFEKSNMAGSALFDIEARILGLNTVDKDGRVVAIPVSLIHTLSGL
ncbi:MAG TPA: serine protease [Candidatus Humimicrobiaceae bacterium]|nr:serine protease [Candidatus Humimicrobiaceae bacterium]